MSRRIPFLKKMLNGTSTSVSAGERITDYRNCILTIIGSANANLKIFVKGAISTDAEFNKVPTFDIRSSNRNATGNAWDFVEVVDLEDGTAIDGDDGVNLSGNNVRLLEVNINSLDWLAVEATAIVAGTVTVVGSFTTNQ